MSQPLHATPPALSTPPTPQQTGRRILINTGALAGSSLWRIVISFLLQLMIARQLGVVSFGQYTIALAYLHVCQIISELGLPTLLVRDLAQMPQLRRSYFFIALRIQSLMAVAAWGGLILITLALPLSPSTQMVLWVVGASLPFYAITSACQMLFQSGERMEYVMGIELLINTLILGLSILVLFSGGIVYHLVAVLVITQCISALLSLLLVRQSQLLAVPQEIVLWQWSMLWRRSGPFFGLALADVLLQRADIVLLSIFGGEIVVGIYSAAYNLLRVALKLVQNFWAALYPTLSRLFHQTPTHYRRLAMLMMNYSLLALLTAAAIGAGVTPELLALVYGDGFDASAVVLQILIWTAPIYLVENYAQTLLMVERRPLQSLYITGVHLTTLVILLPLFTTGFALLPNVLSGAVGAALAAFIAGCGGGVTSLWLRRRWALPGRLRLPWLVWIMTITLTFFTLYLPLGWFLRVVLGCLLFVIIGWFSGLFNRQDWELLRRVLQRTPK